MGGVLDEKLWIGWAKLFDEVFSLITSTTLMLILDSELDLSLNGVSS